jgi:hypothetical protein
MRIRCMRLSARMRETRNGCKILAEKLERNTRDGWKDSSKIHLREMEYGVWIKYN